MKSLVKNLMITGALGLTIAGASSAQTLVFHNNSAVERAGQALQAGNLEKARVLYKRATRSNLAEGERAPVYNNLCAVEYALGNFEAAETACDNAIGEDRRYWRAYVNRGNARTQLGKKQDARLDYEKAVRIRPSSKVANRALARFDAEAKTLLAAAQ